MLDVISLERPQWKWASSRLEGRTSWIFSSCGRCSRLTTGTSGTRSGALRKGQSPCELLGGLSGFLSHRCRGLRLPGASVRKPARDKVMRKEADIRKACSDFRDRLWWPQERPVPMRVEWRPLGIPLPSMLGLRPCLESVPEPEDSSRVLTWILGYFWSLPRRITPRLEWGHARALFPQL